MQDGVFPNIVAAKSAKKNSFGVWRYSRFRDAETDHAFGFML